MNVNMEISSMEPGLEITRGSHFDDCVVFTTLFGIKQDYFDFNFRVDFGLQKSFTGDILFSIYNKNMMHNLLHEETSVKALPFIEALVETRTMIIRAMYDDSEGQFFEGVETYRLEDWDINELISMRDTILQEINYGGGFSAIGN